MSFAAKLRHTIEELRFGGRAAGGVGLLIAAAALVARDRLPRRHYQTAPEASKQRGDLGREIVNLSEWVAVNLIQVHRVQAISDLAAREGAQRG